MKFLRSLFMPKFMMSFAPEEELDLSAQEELEKELGFDAEEEGAAEKKEEDAEDEGEKKEEDAAAESKEDEGKEEKEEIEDEEIDLKDLGKLKKSELKDLIEKGRDYTKKTQELSEKEKSVKELQDWAGIVKGNKKAIDYLVKFSSKLVNDKGEYDEAMLERAKSALEDKVVDAKENLSAQEIELQRELDELDPDSPMYKVVKGSLDQIKQLQSRLDQTEKETLESKQAKAEEEFQNQVKAAQQVYKDTLDSLADPEKENSLKFESSEGKEIWQSLVASYMKDNPKDYKDEADFVKTLTEVGTACHQTVSKFSEAIVAKYLKSKKPADKTEEEEQKEEKKVSGSIGDLNSLESAVAGALEEEMKT